MSDERLVLDDGNGSVVAPAGYGKTETIAKVAGSCRRALILTHTHAGVHAIRARLRKLEVPYRQAHVDTFAGWCMRYASAFKCTAQPPPFPPQGNEWNQLYVRRQGFWNQGRPKLIESLAHLVGLIMRRAGGDASAVLRVSFV